MADQTQQVTTVWTWDTTNVEMATKRLEQSWSREEAARKKAIASQQADSKKAKAGGGGHGGHDAAGGNLAWGIHDLAEGRLRNAFGRFATAAKLGASATAGAFLAFKAGDAVLGHMREEMEATDKAAVRLNESLRSVSKTATFSTVGDGPEKLAGVKDSLLEQRRSENQQLGELAYTKGVENYNYDDHGWMAKALGRLNLPLYPGMNVSLKDASAGQMYKAYDSFRTSDTAVGMFGLAQTTDQKIREGKLGRDLSGQKEGQHNRLIAGAYGLDRDIARAKGVGGDPFAAQQLEVNKRELVETAEARSHNNGTPENLALVKEKYDIERRSIDLADRAAQRQIDGESKLLSIKARGGAVEVASAKERLQLAGKALQAQPFYTKEYNRALNEQTKSQQDVAIAERQRKTELAGHRIDMSTAGFRGNSDQRAARTAQAEVDKAREKLQILQETKGVKATEQELNEANLAIVTAETAKELLRRQQAEARLQLESTVRMAPGTVRAAGALLAGASDEGAQKEGLMQQARAAVEALAVATKRAEIEKGSVESLRAQADAARELAQAQTAIALHVQHIRRERRYAMQGAQGETAALRFGLAGREELGERASQRAQSQIAIERANQEGHPQLAAELAAQQGLREQKTLADMYLNPDGTRRSQSAVQREINDRRIKQNRFEAFNREHPLGLSNVHRGSHGELQSGVDMLTGERLNARQIAERASAASARIDNAKDDRSDREIQQEIFKLLNTRLPEAAK